ncbi:MAG: SPFH domain-containing protein [Anaerolineae bacterium]|nr:SPFH domain-containing protein [Anaerolineae bacterium]
MILSVDYDTAVLTTLDGKPKGVYMIGQHTLPPHEQILAVIDLRPQRAIQTDVVALTRDGIYVTSDLEIAYTIKHSDTPSIDNPYPVDQMVLHGIVYRLPVFDSENSPLQAYIMLFAVDQFRNVIAHYRFTELYEQSTEDTVLRTLICDEIKERLLPMGEELGIEINSVRLGLLKVPEQRVREQMIADWARLRDLEIRLRVAPDTASLRAQELTTILKTVLELIYSDNGKSISDIIPQVRELHDLTVSLADLMSAAQYALSSGAEDIGKGASIPEPGELWSREWVEQQRKRAREILQEIQEWAARRPSNPPEFEDDVDFMD